MFGGGGGHVIRLEGGPTHDCSAILLEEATFGSE